MSVNIVYGWNTGPSLMQRVARWYNAIYKLNAIVTSTAGKWPQKPRLKEKQIIWNEIPQEIENKVKIKWKSNKHKEIETEVWNQNRRHVTAMTTTWHLIYLTAIYQNNLRNVSH